MFARFLGKDYQRRKALTKAAPGPLADYLATPFPDKQMDCREIEVVAIDLETTGLDPKKDAILSIYDGMQTAIDTGQSYQTRLDPPPGPPTDNEGNFIPMANWDESNWPAHIHSQRVEARVT